MTMITVRYVRKAAKHRNKILRTSPSHPSILIALLIFKSRLKGLAMTDLRSSIFLPSNAIVLFLCPLAWKDVNLTMGNDISQLKYQ